MPTQKRHLTPDFCVGRRIRILKIFHIFLWFDSAVRLELGRKLPFLDGHRVKMRGADKNQGERCKSLPLIFKDTSVGSGVRLLSGINRLGRP